MNTPVLLVVFNRPELTARVMDAISRARPQRLYVACDGPRRNQPADLEQVARTRALVMSRVDWECRVETLFREENLGCGPAVSRAVDWFFEHEAEGIILEDDCVPSGSFFRYCEELLGRFRDDTRVMVIAGTDVVHEPDPDLSYHFSRFSLMWGWATWRRAWTLYDYGMRSWPQQRLSRLLATVGMGDRAFVRTFRRLFDASYAQSLNAWDYQWLYCCWVNSGLTALPTVNLVQNIGFGPDATHTTDAWCPGRANVPAVDIGFPLKHPLQVLADDRRDWLIAKRWFRIGWNGNVRHWLAQVPFARECVHRGRIIVHRVRRAIDSRE
jgi:hypothetical protein